MQLWHFPNAYTHVNTIVWRATKTSAPAVPPSRLAGTFGPLLTAVTHALHLLAFLLATHLFPALQPALNTLVFVLRSAGLPKELPPTHGWEAQAMDCLYWQLVDQWAVPFAAPGAPDAKAGAGPADASGGALAALRSFLGYLESPAGRRTALHAPLELRFGASDALPLSPLYAPPSSAPATFLWFEPIVYRPLNLPSPALPRVLPRVRGDLCAVWQARTQHEGARAARAHAGRRGARRGVAAREGRGGSGWDVVECVAGATLQIGWRGYGRSGKGEDR
jgi:hypothetical protein